MSLFQQRQILLLEIILSAVPECRCQWRLEGLGLLEVEFQVVMSFLSIVVAESPTLGPLEQQHRLLTVGQSL